MEKWKWLAKKHGPKVFFALTVLVVLAFQIFDKIDANQKEMSLKELETKAAAHQVKEATVDSGAHTVDVVLTDGRKYTAVFPVEYDVEMVAVLKAGGVDYSAKNQNFWDQNKGLLILVAILVGASFIPVLVMWVKTRFMVRSRRVTNVRHERFSDVIGAAGPVREAEELVDYLRHPEKYEKAGVHAARGILMYGPSGTGKTLLARAIAGEAGVPFYAFSGSDFAAGIVGEGVDRVKAMFKAARNVGYKQPAIVFVDEIDVAGAKRVGGGGGDRAAVEVLTQLLVEMDGFLSQGSKVVLIGATNRPEVLDSALTRPGRLTRKLYMPEPGIAARAAMLKKYAAKLPMLSGAIDFDYLARRTTGLSGAEIASIANTAGLLALREGVETVVETHHFAAALAQHIAGQERTDTTVHEDDRVVVAIHEAGHAIVALLTPLAPRPDEVSIIPRGDAGGMTFLTHNDRKIFGREKVEAQIAVCMASVAAEKLGLDGKFTACSAHDRVTATQLAQQAICLWGMGSFSAAISLDDWVFDPRSEQITDEIEAWLKAGEEAARELLVSNHALLMALRDLLLEQESVSKRQLWDLAAQYVDEDALPQYDTV